MLRAVQDVTMTYIASLTRLTAADSAPFPPHEDDVTDTCAKLNSHCTRCVNCDICFIKVYIIRTAKIPYTVYLEKINLKQR